MVLDLKAVQQLEINMPDEILAMANHIIRQNQLVLLSIRALFTPGINQEEVFL
jgi:hypothetical protein